MRIHYEFDTVLPPKGVVSALTDFSDHRPMLWPNIDPGKYRVHEVGGSYAVVTEGNRTPDLWARERYDWSTPGKVSWTVEESNFCAPGGSVVATISDGPDGGSHVKVDWERTPTTVTGFLAAAAVRLGRDRALGLRAALDHLAPYRPDGRKRPA